MRLRPLAEPYPYLILDARYERVREGGVIASQAVLIAIAVDADGRRQVLGVELANRESGKEDARASCCARDEEGPFGAVL